MVESNSETLRQIQRALLWVREGVGDGLGQTHKISFSWKILDKFDQFGIQGPVVQRAVSLTSLLRIILLTVLVDSIHNTLDNFCWKNVSSFCTAKATHIFSAKNFSIFVYHSMQILTNCKLTMSLALNNWAQSFP